MLLSPLLLVTPTVPSTLSLQLPFLLLRAPPHPAPPHSSCLNPVPSPGAGRWRHLTSFWCCDSSLPSLPAPPILLASLPLSVKLWDLLSQGNLGWGWRGSDPPSLGLEVRPKSSLQGAFPTVLSGPSQLEPRVCRGGRLDTASLDRFLSPASGTNLPNYLRPSPA